MCKLMSVMLPTPYNEEQDHAEAQATRTGLELVSQATLQDLLLLPMNLIILHSAH